MLIMKDNKIGPARVKVSSSPSYTLKEIEALAWEYCNDATSAARLEDRLRLSLFVQWLAKREREGLG